MNAATAGGAGAGAGLSISLDGQGQKLRPWLFLYQSFRASEKSPVDPNA